MSSRTAVSRSRAVGALRGERRQPVEVDGEVVELVADLRVVDAGGGLAHVGDRPAAVEPLGGPLRQATARPAVDLGEVGAVTASGSTAMRR